MTEKAKSDDAVLGWVILAILSAVGYGLFWVIFTLVDDDPEIVSMPTSGA